MPAQQPYRCAAFRFTRNTILSMQKLLPLVNGLFFFGCCYFNNGHGDRRHELDFVGMYYLTNYPNYDSCKVNLVDNNSYVVLKNGKVTEKAIGILKAAAII